MSYVSTSSQGVPMVCLSSWLIPSVPHYHTYIIVPQNPIILKPITKKSRTPIFFSVHKLAFLLLLTTFCMISSVLLLDFSFLPRCISKHYYPPRLGRESNVKLIEELNLDTFDNDYLLKLEGSSNLDTFDKDDFWKPEESNLDTFENNEFWKPQDRLELRPCLNFSEGYKKSLIGIGSKGRFLMVVVSGGLNQQRNQIVDAVIISKILNASLVIPILRVHRVWGDKSGFSDIFDYQHFKDMLKNDVNVVSTLPSNYRRKQRASVSIRPSNVSENWIRTQLMGRLKKYGVMILRGFNSRLSKNLNPDLQKLRCKVAFHALKFRPWIEELGEKLAERMSKGNFYMALHLRLEKDVWAHTGCSTGLDEEVNPMIGSELTTHRGLLTSRSKIPTKDRYISGLCPMNAIDITRLLKALGASNATRIYWAGGKPFGGEKALEPLRTEFPQLYNKWALAQDGELDHLKKHPSILAAIDYIVCLKSQVFMASHGGNMAYFLQAHRTFLGHRKNIIPNKKQIVKLFMNNSLDEKEMEEKIRTIHLRSKLIGKSIRGCICTSMDYLQIS